MGIKVLLNDTIMFSNVKFSTSSNEFYSIGHSYCSFVGYLKSVQVHQGAVDGNFVRKCQSLECSRYPQNLTNPNCVSCNASEYLNLTDGKCMSCPSRCLNCSNDSNCTLCKSNSILENGTCYLNVTECGPSEYFDLEYEKCMNCSTHCTICNHSSFCLNCTQLSNKIRGIVNNTWAQYCASCNASSYYDTTNFACITCPESCESCISDSNCTTCKSNYTLMQGNCSLDLQINPNSSNSTSNFTLNSTNQTGHIRSNDTMISNTISNTQKTLNTLLDVLLTTIVSIAGPTLALGADPTLLWGLAHLMQMFYYLLFFNVQYPENLAAFLRIFSMGRLEFVPNPFDQVVQNIDGDLLISPPNFFENNFSGLLLQSSGLFICMNLSTIGLYGVLNILNKFEIKFVKFKKMIKEIQKHLKWSGMLRTFTTTFFEMCISSFLQLWVMNFDQFTYGLSSLLAATVVFINVLMLGKIYFAIQKLSDSREAHEKILPIIEDYDIGHPLKKYFVFLNLSRKFIMAIGIVYCYYSPVFQTFIPALLSFVYFSLLVIYRPHQRQSLNLLEILFEGCFFGIHSLIFILSYDEKLRNIFDERSREDVGLCIEILILLPLLAQLYVVIREEIMMIKNFIKTIRNFLKKRKLENLEDRSQNLKKRKIVRNKLKIQNLNRRDS